MDHEGPGESLMALTHTSGLREQWLLSGGRGQMHREEPDLLHEDEAELWDVLPSQTAPCCAGLCSEGAGGLERVGDLVYCPVWCVSPS